MIVDKLGTLQSSRATSITNTVGMMIHFYCRNIGMISFHSVATL